MFLLGKSHGQRSLVGYSPWATESNTAEWLSTWNAQFVYPGKWRHGLLCPQTNISGLFSWFLLGVNTFLATNFLGFCEMLKIACMPTQSNSLGPHGLWPSRLCCPWNFPSKNTGASRYCLLQGIFLTQGLNPCLLRLQHWEAGSLPLSYLGSPLKTIQWFSTGWHLAMTGDFFVCVTTEHSATGIYWVETKNAVRHPAGPDSAQRTHIKRGKYE